MGSIVGMSRAMKMSRYFALSAALFSLLLSAFTYRPKLSSAKTSLPNPFSTWQNKLVSEEPAVVEPRPEVAHGMGRFGVTWDSNKTGDYEIYFALLDSHGNRIGDVLRITNDPGSSRDPTVAFDGKNFGIIWYDNPAGQNRGVYFAAVSPKGVLKIGPVRVNDPSADGVHPSALWNGRANEYAVTWWDGRNGGAYFGRVTRQGQTILETQVSTQPPNAYYRPMIGTSGKEYAIAWTQWVTCSTGNCPEMAFARVSKDGTKISDDAVITSYGATRVKSVTWNGSEWGLLVGLGHYAKLLRVSQEGGILQPPISLGNIMMSNANMVWNGKKYGIGWVDGRWITPENPLNGEVAFQTFDRSGNPLSEVKRVSFGTGPSWNSSPLIVVGNRFALVWVENLYLPSQVILFAQGK